MMAVTTSGAYNTAEEETFHLMTRSRGRPGAQPVFGVGVVSAGGGGRHGGGAGHGSKPPERGGETRRWRLGGSRQFVLAVGAVLSAAGVFLCGQFVRVEERPAQGSSHGDKETFHSVLIVSGLSPLFVWVWREFTGVRTVPSLLALMGIRFEGLIPAIILPLLLTMVLFLGPLMQLAMDCPWSFMDGLRVAFDPCFWALCFSDMRWLRNQVVAPLTEELVFRACMLPMLCPAPALHRHLHLPSLLWSGMINSLTCFCPPAHFHHVIELLRFRQGTLLGIFLSAVFQFSYTAVFGAYTAFIFIRTGHLMGPVLCHSFCNYMGFLPSARPWSTRTASPSSPPT
ncbi:hypothetical protein INR49_002741 [Caranx melampygus]|nr:hypothetical protein INR49_002741 [Caranx melampygus]